MTRDYEFSELEKAKIEYTSKVLIGEITKILILLIFFSLLGKAIDLLYVLSSLILLRPFTGGFHNSTYIKCLIFTLLFTVTVLYISNILILSPIAIIIIAISELVIIFLKVPVYGHNRPTLSSNQCIKFKVISSVVVILHLLLFFLTKTNPYLQVAVWVHIIQLILLSLKGGKYEIIYEHKNR